VEQDLLIDDEGEDEDGVDVPENGEMGGGERKDSLYIPSLPRWFFLRLSAGSKSTILTGMVVWFLHTLRKGHSFVIHKTHQRLFDVDRLTIHRGLLGLEQLGLVSLERKRNHPVRVTVIKNPHVKAAQREASGCHKHEADCSKLRGKSGESL
jgi:hypothetical protein